MPCTTNDMPLPTLLSEARRGMHQSCQRNTTHMSAFIPRLCTHHVQMQTCNG
jgi:hypothetical protein